MNFRVESGKPQVVALSGNTDCYQPVEKKKQLTRRCLEVFFDFRNPVVIITKNQLVTRDIDHSIAASKVPVHRRDGFRHHPGPKLASLLEPRASTPKRRLAAIRALSDAGVPVGYLQAPMIPVSPIARHRQ